MLPTITRNCAHVPLEEFGDRFALTCTVGKLANIASEVGDLDKAAEGYLKSFTSGDTMQFDRKHKPPIQSVPTARLTLSTNNRPRFSDRTDGLWRRMILMPLRATIADDDPSRIFGMDKVQWWNDSGELPGLLNWSLVGLDRLRRQGRFTKSKVCEAALLDYKAESNPARMFLNEVCRADPESSTPTKTLYESYRQWCTSSGYCPLADRAFGKEVKRAFPNSDRKKISLGGLRTYVYQGLADDNRTTGID